MGGESLLQPRKDRLAASAVVTEMSPLNGFPVLDAKPPYPHSSWEL